MRCCRMRATEMENAFTSIWTDTLRLACKAVVAVGLLSVPDVASACTVRPDAAHWGADELIEKSETIVLATVVEKDEIAPHGEYWFRTLLRFKTVEILSGFRPEYFELSGQDIKLGYYSQDFHNHSDEEFWTKNIGRTPRTGGCYPIHTFIEGETYLLFLDWKGAKHVAAGSNPQYAMKSAEIIRVPDDKWLHYVRDSIDGN